MLSSCAVRFVLVDTAFPSNMGAAARAIATMGFDDLVFVRPKRSPTHERALLTATHAAALLENAPTFSNLAEAVVGCELVLATSNRCRARTPMRWSLRDLPKSLLEQERSAIAIVFGNETTGLMNDDIVRCDGLLSIPAATEVPSLNLAQAVMVTAYELSKARTLHGRTTSCRDVAAHDADLRQLRREVMLTLSAIRAAGGIEREVQARLPLLDRGASRLVFKLVRLVQHALKEGKGGETHS